MQVLEVSMDLLLEESYRGVCASIGSKYGSAIGMKL